MALTNRQTQLLWRADARKKAKYYRKYTIAWRKLYILQGEKMLNSLSNGDIISRSDMLPEASQALYTEMYRDTGVDFAANSFMTVKADTASKVSDIWEQKMEDYALTEGAQSLRSIVDTKLEEAKKIIRNLTNDAIALGLGADETAAFIEAGILDQWKIYGKWSSVRIARTEIISASNYGSLVGAQSTGLELRKVWLATPAGDFRKGHLELNGKSVPLNRDFRVDSEFGPSDMSFPGDKKAPAHQVINCRCSVRYQSPLLD